MRQPRPGSRRRERSTGSVSPSRCAGSGVPRRRVRSLAGPGGWPDVALVRPGRAGTRVSVRTEDDRLRGTRRSRRAGRVRGLYLRAPEGIVRASLEAHGERCGVRRLGQNHGVRRADAVEWPLRRHPRDAAGGSSLPDDRRARDDRERMRARPAGRREGRIVALGNVRARLRWQVGRRPNLDVDLHPQRKARARGLPALRHSTRCWHLLQQCERVHRTAHFLRRCRGQSPMFAMYLRAANREPVHRARIQALRRRAAARVGPAALRTAMGFTTSTATRMAVLPAISAFMKNAAPSSPIAKIQPASIA